MKKNEFKKNNNIFLRGMKDGIPIALAYFAVSFSLGIAAKHAGLSAAQGFFASLFTSASAGEYAGFSVIAEQGSYLSMMLVTLIASSRYLLMSCVLSQKLDPGLPLGHRLLLGFYVTDELFGITMAQPGYAKPQYTYGAIAVSVPAWAAGTALGIITGSILPSGLVTALGVSLFGMFLAIIIPPAKDNKLIFAIVLTSFAASTMFTLIPFLNSISSGFRIIILTVIISCFFAYFYPVKEEEKYE